jgi:hypothetical protein
MIASLTLILVSFLSQLSNDDPPKKPDAPVVGRWLMKSATVGGKTATAKDLIGLLKDLGGCELSMVWKFRKDSFGSANDVGIYYEYSPETKEVTIQSDDPEKHLTQVLDVKIVGKDMTMRFKEKGKTVVMLFVSED